jgi:predicted nucleic acid-binding protein
VIDIPRGRALSGRQGGTKANVLADSFIGAHSAVAGLLVLTRDVRRIAGYFPTVRLIALT